MRERHLLKGLMRLPRLALCLLGIFSGFTSLRAAEIVVVAFGDSTTAPRAQLSVYAELLPPRLAAELGVAVKMINAGVPGNTTDHARQRLATDVLARQPDLVIIQFGINDSAMDVWKTPPVTHTRVAKETYRKNLEYFVTEIRGHGGQVMFMTPNPKQWSESMRQLYGKPPYQVDDPDGFNRNLRPFAAEMRGVAADLDVPLLDVMAAYDESLRTNPQKSLLSDGVHPNQGGQQLVTDLLVAFLKQRPHLLKAQGETGNPDG